MKFWYFTSGDNKISEISKEILEQIPKECEECGSTRIEYQENDGKEYIFQCIDCGLFYPVPIDPKKRHMLLEH